MREERGECPVLVVGCQGETHAEVGIWITDDAAVVFVDDAIAIDVAVDESSNALPLLNGVVGHLVGILEDAVADIAVVDTHGLAFDEPEVTSDDANLVVEANQFVAVHRHVEVCIPGEVAILRRMVTEVKLETVVLHLARIHEFGRILTSHGEHRRNGNHVLGVLPVVVKAEAYGTVEEIGIKTDVGLRGCLPFQVRITRCGHLDTADHVGVRAIEVVGSVAKVVGVGGEGGVVVGAPEKAGKMPELWSLCRREVWSRRSVAEKR